MYSYICGKVVDKNISCIVVENNGIGYELGVSENTSAMVNVGEYVKIYAYLYVREDTMALYGFARAEEKNIFLKLIEISGIGPKMALQILSGYDLKTLLMAIATGDVKTLAKIKGLGKKTAELLIVNLRESFSSDISLGTETGSLVSDDVSDAVAALESLGISRVDAVKAVNEATKHVEGVENIIAYALKGLL